MHEFDGKALIFMIFNNDAIKKELSGLLDTSRQARRHHLIFLLKIALAMFLILCFAGFAIGIGFVRGAIDAAPSLDILDVQPQGYASQIYDADGNLMQTLVMEGSNREEVSFDQLPDDLVNAFIAIDPLCSFPKGLGLIWFSVWCVISFHSFKLNIQQIKPNINNTIEAVPYNINRGLAASHIGSLSFIIFFRHTYSGFFFQMIYLLILHFGYPL